MGSIWTLLVTFAETSTSRESREGREGQVLNSKSQGLLRLADE